MKRMNEVFELPVSSNLFEVSGYIPVKKRSISNGLEADEYAAHAINNVDSLTDALEDALLQIEYIHQTFEETGSGNSVLLRGYAVLNAYRGAK